jgi:Domain of unknown function (DUF4149)
MKNVARFIQALSLGTWVGSIIYFVAIVTRGAFAVLTPDQAGPLVAFTLSGLHEVGIIAAVAYLISAAAIAMSIKALARPAALCVLAMLFLTLASQRLVIPRMETLRREMVSIESIPPTDPRRAEFDKLHSISVDFEAAVLLTGLAAIFLNARQPRER